jgi:rhamnose transport system ATP-binding protein
LKQEIDVSDSQQPGLIASGICLSFASMKVLNDASIQLFPGRIHAITGENGAGKSSLGKVFAGLYQPDEGVIRLDGEVLRLSSPRDGLAHGIALIHQEPLTFSDLSIAENILVGNLPLKKGRIDWKLASETSAALLKRLGSDLDVTKNAGTLSIADQQLLELAAALSHDARVWIFDETTAPLTPPEVRRLFTIIRELRDQGCCIAFVSHHLDEVFEIADDITVLRGGQCVACLKTQETTQSEIIRHMVGREVRSSSRELRDLPAEVALKVDHLSGPGFQDVSFEVRAGEIFGISGLVGAGRTEVARSLFGITKPTAGSVHLFGEPLSPKTPRESIKRGIQLVPEDRRGAGLMIDRSILENASVVQLKTFAGSLGLLDFEKQESSIRPLLARLRTALTSVQQPVGQLSGGNQQKVALAKSLLEIPKILILDEPTRGVDVGAKFDVHTLIRELADSGVTVVLISSDLPEVLSLSDRIGVMRRGSMVGTLDGPQASQEQILALASGGDA